MEDTDLLLVERAGTSYKIETQDMSNLQDSDLLLVERAGVSYKMTADQLPSSGPTGTIEAPVSVLTPLNGAGLNAGATYQPLSTAITAVNAGGDVVYATDTIASVGVAPAWDQSETWSSLWVGTAVYGGFVQVHDGSSSGYVQSTDATITFPSPISANSLSVRYSAAFGTAKLYVNGDDVSNQLLTTGGVVTSPITGFPSISTIKITASDFVTNAFTLYGININGLALIDAGIPGDPGAGSLLTFPTDNNFDKFEVGDVVQGSTSGDIFNAPAFDTEPVWSATPDGSTWTNYTASDNITSLTSVGVSIGVWQSNDLTTWTRTDVVEEANLPRPLYSGDTYTYLRLGGLVTNKSATLSGAEFAGTKITAIDDTVPSITVNGGSWYGQDGSGDSGDGRFEPDQAFSANVINTGSGVNQGPISVAFNGTVGPGGADERVAPLVGQSLTLPISGSSGETKVDVTGAFSGTSNVLEINGVAVSTPNTGAPATNTYTLANGVTSIKWHYRSANEYLYLLGIKINDKLLVDSSVPGGGGDTDITKTVSSDASLTFTDDTELANMVGPLSQVDASGNVKTPVTSEIASVGVGPAWNQSAVWSSQVTGNPYPSSSGSGADKGFDGNLSTLCQTEDAGGTLVWTPLGGLAYTTSVRILTFGPASESQPTRISLNGGTEVEGIADEFVTLATGSGSITTITARYTATYRAGWYAIEVDGKLLVDTGISGDPGAGELLTFASPNPDLQYFQPGDNVGTDSGFTPVIYTGNGGTQSITGLGFSPDLVWIKARFGTSVGWHCLADSIRGAGNLLYSNDTSSEDSQPTSITSFDADGFTLGSYTMVNIDSSTEYVAWCFDAGDTTVTNNDGTIASQVRSNGNFSVVSYTGNGTQGASFGCGLSNGPDLIIIKNLDTAGQSWPVYHSSLGNTQRLYLNGSGAQSTGTNWNNTTPSNVVSMGVNPDTNENNSRMIAYCWAETPGVSSFGQYSGTGAPYSVECGFEPAFVLIKSTDSDSWRVLDNARNTNNPRNSMLFPDAAEAEITQSAYDVDFTATGFTLMNDYLASGGSFIYAAFAGNNPIEIVDVDVVNNQMTVNGGAWLGQDGSGGDGRYEPSQEWSSQWSPLVENGIGVSGVFNGDISNVYEGRVTSFSDWTITTPLTVNTEVYIYVGPGSYGSTVSVTVKGATDVTKTKTINDGTETFMTWSAAELGNTFKGLTLNGAPAGSDTVYLSYVKVDGKVLVDSSVPGGGETVVTGQPLIASADDVEYLDGNTLGVNGVSGTWFPGLNAQGAEVNAYAPSPQSIIFTSMNGGTTEFTGTDASLTSRTWTLEKSNAVTGPWTEVGVYLDYAANVSQDGATPWANPSLEANKFYQVKVEYSSNNAASVVSTFNTFKTGDA